MRTTSLNLSYGNPNSGFNIWEAGSLLIHIPSSENGQDYLEIALSTTCTFYESQNH